MDSDLLKLIRDLAGNRCEYCKLPQSASRLTFVLDHITARQHGGESVENNLALCCPFCNLRKGPNVAGVDPQDQQICRLFHPRKDRWSDHFEWDRHIIVTRSAIARTTAKVLAMNHAEQMSLREALLAASRFWIL